MMKVFMFFVVAAAVLQSNGSLHPNEKEMETPSRPLGFLSSLSRVATKCLRVETNEATVADRAFLHTHGGAIAQSLMGESEKELDATAGKHTSSAKPKPQKTKRSEGVSGETEENGFAEKRKKTAENSLLTQEMQKALKVWATENNGTITLAEARTKLMENYPDLDEKELRNSTSKLYQALRNYLSHNQLLETVQVCEKRITPEMKEALKALAEENGGTITIAEARTKLMERYPTLAEDLQNSTSRFYKALRDYLSYNKLLEAVQVHEERLTPEMQKALQTLAEENDGKITVAAARTKLMELTPELADDLKNSTSKLYYALRSYLRNNKLLETVQEERLKSRITLAIDVAWAEMRKDFFCKGGHHAFSVKGFRVSFPTLVCGPPPHSLPRLSRFFC